MMAVIDFHSLVFFLHSHIDSKSESGLGNSGYFCPQVLKTLSYLFVSQGILFGSYCKEFFIFQIEFLFTESSLKRFG